jgi:hypothetical protein
MAVFPPPFDGLFAPARPLIWTPVTVSSEPALPVDLTQVANRQMLAGLTLSQQNFLSQNGFVVLQTRDENFARVRQRVSQRYGQPYYLTTDAAYFALHQTLDWLFAALEREELHPRLVGVVRSVFSETLTYLPLLRGSELERDANLAAAYLGVGLKLLDPAAEMPADLEDIVQEQVAQIMAAEGVQELVLVPGLQDDLRAYQPPGHYSRAPELAAYFRGVTWFERVAFAPGSSSSAPGARLPLIVTYALRKSGAAEEWAQIEQVFEFLVGPSQSNGPRQYAQIMDQVYGRTLTVVGLQDEGAWQIFQALAQQLFPPQIDSAFITSVGNPNASRHWHFLNQRFRLDNLIFQNLIYERVGSENEPRQLPSGLDIPFALGSASAARILGNTGATQYQNYPQQMEKLQFAVQNQRQDQWIASLEGIWLYTLLGQLEPKGQAFLLPMRSEAWADKDLNSALGGWVMQRYDMPWPLELPQAGALDDRPVSAPAPAYVEPAPDVFYRLAYLASITAEGLEQRGMNGGDSSQPLSLSRLLQAVRDLATRYQQLGDLADKQLAGKELETSDFATIQAPLGLLEELASPTFEGLSPTPGIVTITGNTGQHLQAGVGLVNRILALVPLEGSLQVAQGGVFSYYEFLPVGNEPISNPSWQQAFRVAPAPALPDWSAAWIFTGGVPVDVLAFRVGDTYRISPQGGQLNLRQEASRTAPVVQQLRAGDYVKIIAGPLQSQSFTWWKMQLIHSDSEIIEGWAVQEANWFERAQ